MNEEMFGSASFIEPEGQSFEEVCNGENLFLGNTLRDPNKFLSLKPKKHLLTVAGTTGGKGASLIINNLLNYQGSCLVIDPKGENAFLTAQRRRDMGQKVVILDPWGIVNSHYGAHVGIVEEIATFNPLSILDPEDPDYADDISYFADALILSQSKDPFFDDSARDLVAGLIAYAAERKHEDFPDVKPTFPMVRQFLAKPAEQIAGIAADAQSLGPDSIAALKLCGFLEPSKTVDNILLTARTQTSILDHPTLKKSLSSSSFSFDDLTARPTTIYLVLPADKLQSHGRWLRLMVSIGIRTIARNTKRLPIPVLFLLDEFGTIGKLSSVATAFGLMAGMRIFLWVFLQDLVQLKRDYPHDWETFIGNSQAVTCFNLMDLFTTDYISKMLGQTTIEQVSEASTYVRNKTKNSVFTTDQDRPHSRPLMTSDEVRRLNKRFGLIITNHGPYFYRKVYYFDEPRFAALARENPLETKTPQSEKSEGLPSWSPLDHLPTMPPFVETPPPSASAPTPHETPIKTEWPTKTKTEMQLAAFQQQVLIPTEGLAQTPKHPLAWFLMFLPFNHSGEAEVAENARIDEANKYIKIYENLELDAINQNEKMRAYGIEDVDGFGFYEVNKTAHAANVRSIRAALERNAEKIAQYEKENGLEVVEAQAKKIEEFL